MDLLSSVLREVRLESAAYRLLELRAPWRLRFDGGLRGVHVVASGRCVLQLDGEPPRDLGTGDLVVLPQADAHELGSVGSAGLPTLSSLDLARRTPGTHLAAGGDGERTTVVCGAFTFGDADHPAVAGFPRCVRVPAEDGRPPGWVAGVAGALLAEARDGGPGSEVVMARLSDAVVTRALRHHLQTADEPGWLRGLHDPHVARALAAVHADLAAPWTVAALARVAGLSRAAFAARFTAAVGQPPAQYLSGARMRRAMTLLRAEGATAAGVASRVGYASEASFAVAFTRHAGCPPGAWRRRARSRTAAAGAVPPPPPVTPVSAEEALAGRW
ncbi:AraC-like DNA-binding protein [Geodermatophilus bullaregiensis]|uniref:AraC family transcriptional regulator n=1 Tax=Geodermatophilus bullaregiensis TaxID=1564160 RepID=UPI0019563D22|nr:AraC family transcriptional regulator [Geodermatophilus bullaregiensis]MBM7804319.1 AraC-like DNA-binding protein [Geodermatophilus bullaregiensis]